MSNLIFISCEGIHSFSFPMKTKAQPFLQCNTSPDFHSEAKTSLQYIGWVNSAVPSTIQCLSAAAFCSSAFKKIQSQQSNKHPGSFIFKLKY